MSDTAFDGLARNQRASKDAAPAAPGQPTDVHAHTQILRTLLTAAQTAREVYVMHISRLCLMLADHHYSRLTGQDGGRIRVPAGYPLYANTDGAYGRFNQTLDEHLIGVAQHSGEVTYALPRFDQHLGRLARHRGLRKRAQDERFR